MPATPAYQELCRVYSRIYRYNHLAAIVGWDRNAMMPPKGNEARAAAEAELNTLIHRTRTDPRLADWLTAAEQEALGDVERANLREIRRDWRDANALPEALVEAKTMAGARTRGARSARPTTGSGFWKTFGRWCGCRAKKRGCSRTIPDLPATTHSWIATNRACAAPISIEYLATSSNGCRISFGACRTSRAGKRSLPRRAHFRWPHSAL